jgi:hypothetical protein
MRRLPIHRPYPAVRVDRMLMIACQARGIGIVELNRCFGPMVDPLSLSESIGAVGSLIARSGFVNFPASGGPELGDGRTCDIAPVREGVIGAAGVQVA